MNLEATFEIRKGDSFKYAREIQKPWGEIDRVIDWCKSELVSDWRWQMVEMSSPQRPGRYIFYFDDSRDFFAFTLHWS